MLCISNDKIQHNIPEDGYKAYMKTQSCYICKIITAHTDIQLVMSQ